MSIKPYLKRLTFQKSLVWIGSEIKTPPLSMPARLQAGFLLRRIQNGESLSFPISRPLGVISRNCHELRIDDREKTWRIVYYIDTDYVVILDVFAKKTQKTPKSVIDICKSRLKKFKG